MPILEKGCFCCELATCVRIQGWVITVAFFALAMADALLLALWIVPREKDPGPGVDEYGRRFISSKYIANVSQGADPELRVYIANKICTKVVLVSLLVCLIVWVLLGFLLLYGIYKRKRMLMWPYMVGGALNVLITTILLVFFASSVNSQIPNMLILLGVLVLQFVLLLHVISLFQRMGEEEREVVSYEQQ